MCKSQSIELDSHAKNFLDPFRLSLKHGLNGLAEIAVARETALNLGYRKAGGNIYGTNGKKNNNFKTNHSAYFPTMFTSMTT